MAGYWDAGWWSWVSSYWDVGWWTWVEGWMDGAGWGVLGYRQVNLVGEVDGWSWVERYWDTGWCSWMERYWAVGEWMGGAGYWDADGWSRMGSILGAGQGGFLDVGGWSLVEDILGGGGGGGGTGSRVGDGGVSRIRWIVMVCNQPFSVETLNACITCTVGIKKRLFLSCTVLLSIPFLPFLADLYRSIHPACLINGALG